MELGCAEKNRFYTERGKGTNRYYLGADVDAASEYLRETNNVYWLSREIKSGDVVFDIGCGQGLFGKQYKEIGCIAYGVDSDRSALRCAEATGGFKCVYACNFMDLESEFIRTVRKNEIEHADIILLSDVLEHSTNPTDIIAEYSKYLKPDGSILVSVPNISNADIILNLMNGKFNYTDMGILDNTHFKFFTKVSFLQWIKQINDDKNMPSFECRYLGATAYESEYVSAVRKKYPELVRILGQQENAGALQIMFKLTKQADNEETPLLNALLKETQRNVVDIIGEALEGKVQNLAPEALTLSQKERTEKLAELNRALEGYIQSDKDKALENESKTLKIQELNRVLEGYIKSDEEKTRENEAKELKIAELNSALEGYIKSDEKKTHENEAKELKIAELNSALEGYIKSDEEKTRENQTKELRIAELNSALEGYIKSDAEKTRENEAKELKIAELNSVLEGYIESDRSKAIEIDEKNSRIYTIENEINRWKADKERLELEAQNLNRKISELNRKIFEMEKSFSWRITKIFRKGN